MRTLVATVMSNAKGQDIYCTAKKVSELDLNIIRRISRQELEDAGFKFIKLLSLEYPNIRGYAIFFEGHVDEMGRVLKNLEKMNFK